LASISHIMIYCDLWSDSGYRPETLIRQGDVIYEEKTH
jgi:hypothetical protein